MPNEAVNRLAVSLPFFRLEQLTHLKGECGGKGQCQQWLCAWPTVRSPSPSQPLHRAESAQLAVSQNLA